MGPEDIDTSSFHGTIFSRRERSFMRLFNAFRSLTRRRFILYEQTHWFRRHCGNFGFWLLRFNPKKSQKLILFFFGFLPIRFAFL